MVNSSPPALPATGLISAAALSKSYILPGDPTASEVEYIVNIEASMMTKIITVCTSLESVNHFSLLIFSHTPFCQKRGLDASEISIDADTDRKQKADGHFMHPRYEVEEIGTSD